jgi:hypothetical protein
MEPHISHMEHHSPSDPVLRTCIDLCTRCHQICLQTALNHCLEKGDKFVEAEHFRLMINCSEICQACANFQLGGSTFSEEICSVCADICEACALSCEMLGEMEDCVRICRECSVSCRDIANAANVYPN